MKGIRSLVALAISSAIVYQMHKSNSATNSTNNNVAANFSSIYMGEPESSVEATVGKPGTTQTEQVAGFDGGPSTTYAFVYYGNYQFSFTNGKLTAKLVLRGG